jgi:hypothetical protein
MSKMRTLIAGSGERPASGDLVLATITEIGAHQRIELPNGRRARLFPGDQVVVCYGNRYAPDQFEALVADDLGTCDLVASGGVCGREVGRHDRMSPPTRIAPLGFVGDAEGIRLNVADFAVKFSKATTTIPTIAVLGTSMNSGKTVVASSLIRGLSGAGLKVAGIKATGTGSGNDVWFMSDMGAHCVLDFTDAGFASTYLAAPEAIERGVLSLIDQAVAKRCEVAVLEIADGLQHKETGALVRSAALLQRVDGVVFAASDALGAAAGVKTLRRLGYKTFAVSGQLTRSPLAIREAIAATGLPVLMPAELLGGAMNDVLLGAQPLPMPTIEINLDLERPAVLPEPSRRQLIRSQSGVDTDIYHWLGHNSRQGSEVPADADD